MEKAEKAFERGASKILQEAENMWSGESPPHSREGENRGGRSLMKLVSSKSSTKLRSKAPNAYTGGERSMQQT